jgi:glycine cleavage system H protein
MSDYPDHLRYTETHEWAELEGEVLTLGITTYALAQLSDLVDVEITCEVGDQVTTGSTVAEIESVKTASDVYAPVDGEVIEVHEGLGDEIDVIAEDPYGKGWMVRIKVADPAAVEALMDADAYEKQAASESH